MKRNLLIDTLILFLIIIGIQFLRSCKKLEKEMMVSTGEVTNIATNSADASGIIIDLAGGVTQHGHCYAKTPNLTTDSTKTDLGTPSGNGGFTSQLKNLEAGTLYYIKAYISDGKETAYGKEISFTTTAAVLPTITTIAVTFITTTTATSGGTVSSDGGAPVTMRGVCWSTTTGSSTANSKTTDGTGTGNYSSSISGLTPGITYYVRAYATNSAGTVYGNELSFTATALSLPTLSTTAITGITQTTVTSGGNITSDGGASVTVRGVCWSTFVNPTTTDNTTSNSTGSGSFVSSLTGLTSNTTYYVRAYATNIVGTAYGNQVSFKTALLLPTLTTDNVSVITPTTAICGGNITSEGDAPVTARGVCWGTTTSPTTANSKTDDGSGTGTFISYLTGLTHGATYYVRAYAINSGGTVYGNEVSFTATITLPTLTSLEITSITSTTASGGGNITDDGGAAITARGVCWSILQNPTISDSKTTDGLGTGSFISDLICLLPTTIYYLRAYATNSVGTAYGSQESFTTLPGGPIIFNPNLTYGIITDVEGNIYKTVSIGPKVWMAENLKTIKYNDNTAIPLVTDNIAWSSLITPGYCWYNNDATTYKAIYGALYNWHAVNTGKLCPTGWHLPSNDEWTTLITLLGGETITGSKMKETGTVHWACPNSDAINSSGFSGLPGGLRNFSSGIFYAIHNNGHWWSTTESSTNTAWYLDLNSDNSNVYRYGVYKTYGFSIRCIKD
jgi:uncharacterized protein (TIGR02145 family)